jgi:hypothetical protein
MAAPRFLAPGEKCRARSSPLAWNNLFGGSSLWPPVAIAPTPRAAAANEYQKILKLQMKNFYIHV